MLGSSHSFAERLPFTPNSQLPGDRPHSYLGTPGAIAPCLRNRVSFCNSTVNYNIHHRNPVSFLGDRALSEKPGFFL